jgi:predicted PurR-regulated permease PerM
MNESPRWPPMTYWMKATVAVLVVLALARILLGIGNILVLIAIALILAMGFQPAVEWLERRGLSRGWAIALGIVGGILIVGGFLWLAVPGIVAEATDFFATVPDRLRAIQSEDSAVGRLIQNLDLAQRIQDLGARIPSTLVSVLGGVAAVVFNALTVLILTIFFTVNLPRMRAGVARLLRRDHRQEFEAILAESTERVGGYVLGQLVVSATAGVVSFIALLIIGVPFAAALAFFTAMLDLIPTIGAIIAAVVATAVAAINGVGDAVATGVFYLAYQQVENYLIQPRVQGRTIQMSAPVIILAVLIGGSLLGVVGALLAIPCAAIIKVMFRELYLEERLDYVRRADSGELDANRPGE